MPVPADEIISMQVIATILFALAVVHTFACGFFKKMARRYPEGSAGENLFHLLGEVEVVFGMWAAVLVAIWAARFGAEPAARYLESVNYQEAGFVFVIMTIAATPPILRASERSIRVLAKLIPAPRSLSLYAVTLIVGPLLGSLITEPAAMTVTALLLRDQIFNRTSSAALKYATLALLFVNVSVGGTLTNFAAPPVLMVAGPWDWSTSFMLIHFGWKAALAVAVGTVLTTCVFHKALLAMPEERSTAPVARMPIWMVAANLGFLVVAIMTSHYLAFLIGLFFIFVGWCSVTREHQGELRIRESLLVAFFLAGLVTLGKLQSWWLAPLLAGMGPNPLFWGATALTAVTDNAAITYLGTLVPDMSPAARYALVAGAVTGGGLTVIANAPNPAGYAVLEDSFGTDGISPLRLFLFALPFTLIAALCFLLN